MNVRKLIYLDGSGRIVDEDLPPGCVLLAADGQPCCGTSYPLEYAVSKALLTLDLAGVRRSSAHALPVPSLN